MTHTVDEIMQLVYSYALARHALHDMSRPFTVAMDDELKSADSAIRTALEQSLPMWRPIDEAPRDGTAIYALLPDSDIPHSVRWRKGIGFAMVWDDTSLCGLNRPTHWQPLPSPPTEPAK